MKILFVCTGNIFRSMSADLCLKEYIQRKSITDLESASAGTHAYPEVVNPSVAYALLRYGIDSSAHKQTKLSKEILTNSDLIVCMADYHQDFIRQHFGEYKTILFNEVCFGKKVNVDDVDDVIIDWNINKAAVIEHEIRTVEHIHNSIPNLVKNLTCFIKK